MGIVVGLTSGEVVLRASVAAEGSVVARCIGTLDALKGCVRVRSVAVSVGFFVIYFVSAMLCILLFFLILRFLLLTVELHCAKTRVIQLLLIEATAGQA